MSRLFSAFSARPSGELIMGLLIGWEHKDPTTRGMTPRRRARFIHRQRRANEGRSALRRRAPQLKIRFTTGCSRPSTSPSWNRSTPSLVSSKVIAAITDILSEEGRLLTDGDRERLIEEIKNELLGLGPLEPLLRDDAVTDILVNGAHQVYVEKRRQAASHRGAVP